MLPLVPEKKMVDVSKLISLGNLLVGKVTWLVLTTTSATLILSRIFGADCMTRIANIYSRLPRTHSLTFFTYRDSTHSLSFSPLWLTKTTCSLSHFHLQRQHTLSLTFWLPAVNPTKMYTFCNLFISCSAFSVRLLQPQTQPQKFCQPQKR